MEKKDERMEVPYFQIPNHIFEVGLDKYEILVYCYLARCSNNKSDAFPSHATIARKTGMSKTTVKASIKKLEQKGILKKQRRKINKTRNDTNLYIIEHELGGGVAGDPGVGQQATQGGAGGDPGVGQQATRDKELYYKELINNEVVLIEELKKRYDAEEQKIINEYFNILRHTRQSAKIADSIIRKELQYFEKFPKIVVLAALKTYISRPDLHGKKEQYVRGIIRNTDKYEAKQILDNVQKENQENKPNKEEEPMPPAWEA